MVSDNDKILIETIITYCDTLTDAVRDYSINETVLEQNLAFRGMMAFFVQQIGECSQKLSADFKNRFSEVEWKAMAGLRNRIAHAYGRIDVEILWDVVENDIPELRIFCATVLGNSSRC